MAGSLRTRSGRDGVKARISRREHGGSGSGARENVSVRKTLNGRLTVDLTQLYRYKLAEKLSERLDEMGKDLTSMIEEVNSASASLSKTNRADEPVCQTSQPYYTLRSFSDPFSYRSPKLSAFSTRTCLNCRSSIKVHPSCRPRLPQLKRLASQSPPGLDTGMLAPAWAEVRPRMISTARTWDGGRW